MEKIYTGKSLEELEALAYSELTALGAAKSDISIEVVEQPVKKLFGKKGDYKIKAVCPDLAEASAPAPAAAPAEAEPVKQAAPAETETASSAAITDDSRKKAAVAAAYLEKVLTALGIENFNVNIIEKEDIIVLDITGENLGAVIGRRGETLDALQYLAILASNRHDEPYCRMTVDCNGYRDKREETLKALAQRTANKVLRQGRRITLEPMNPYERRIIHSTVADIEGIYSNSIGEEPYRKVVISCSQRHADSKRAERRGGNRRGGNTTHRSYKQSSGFSTSFEREYKRSAPAQTDEQPVEYSQETVEAEKNATLYGKIEF
ncbi:MAG: KH domain-containing protein [Eubacterium sp.]|nr:KH domain-containing protein [Eubacterium sp.]